MISTRYLFCKRNMTPEEKTVQEGRALERKFGIPKYGKYGHTSCPVTTDFEGDHTVKKRKLFQRSTNH